MESFLLAGRAWKSSALALPQADRPSWRPWAMANGTAVFTCASFCIGTEPLTYSSSPPLVLVVLQHGQHMHQQPVQAVMMKMRPIGEAIW